MVENPSGMTVNEQKMLRVSSLWFPLTMVVSMIAAVIWFTWVIFSERAQVYGRVDSVAGSVLALQNTVQSLSITVEKLITKIGTPDTDAVTKSQWVVECLQLQIMNPGWLCPYGANRVVTNQRWSSTIELAVKER